jgi:hypothetical protein
MALKLRVKTLDEVAEEHRGLYTEVDGEFVLTVEGLEDTSGLKSALQKERDARKELERKTKSFEGVDLDRYKELEAEALKRKEKELLDAGEVDKLLEERTKAMRKELDSKITGLTEQNEKLNGRLRSVLIDGEIATAAAKAKVRGEAVDVVKMMARDVFTLNDEGNVVAMKDGNILLGKEGAEPLTTGEYVEGLLNTHSYLFEGSSGGGGGPGDGGTPLPKGTIDAGSIGDNLEAVAEGKVAVAPRAE